jgi:hypothetical protein
MTAIATLTANSLPALVQRAAQQLASATSAAEVLEARDAAVYAYDTAKAAARFARAKQAHDDVLSAVYRAQADALEIEAQAKRRLADEYDAAQERGEVVGPNDGQHVAVPDGNGKATAADLGLTRKAVHEARQIRDAEQADPGIVRRTVDAAVTEGREPTRAEVKRATSQRVIPTKKEIAGFGRRMRHRAQTTKRRQPIDDDVRGLVATLTTITKRIECVLDDDRLVADLERRSYIGEFERAFTAIADLYVMSVSVVAGTNALCLAGTVVELRDRAAKLMRMADAAEASLPQAMSAMVPMEGPCRARS